MQIQFENDLAKPFDVAEPCAKRLKTDIAYPVDLELEYILASMPRKVSGLIYIFGFEIFRIPFYK